MRALLIVLALFSFSAIAQDDSVVLVNTPGSFHFERCVAGKCEAITRDLPRDISLKAFAESAPLEWDKDMHTDVKRALANVLDEVETERRMNVCTAAQEAGAKLPGCMESAKNLEKLYLNVRLQVRMQQHGWNRI